MKKLKKNIDNRIQNILFYLQNDHNFNAAIPSTQPHLLSTQPHHILKNVRQSIATNSSQQTNGSNLKSPLAHTNEFSTKEKQNFKGQNEFFMHNKDYLEQVIEECCETSYNSSKIPIQIWSNENELRNDLNNSISQFKNQIFQNRRSSRNPLLERNSQVLNEFSDTNFTSIKNWSVNKKNYRNSSYQRPIKQYSTPKSGHRRSHPYSFCISGGKQFPDLFSGNIRKTKIIQQQTLQKIQQQINEISKKTRKQAKQNNIRTKLLTRVIKTTFKNEEFMMTM